MRIEAGLTGALAPQPTHERRLRRAAAADVTGEGEEGGVGGGRLGDGHVRSFRGSADSYTHSNRWAPQWRRLWLRGVIRPGKRVGGEPHESEPDPGVARWPMNARLTPVNRTCRPRTGCRTNPPNSADAAGGARCVAR